MFPYRKVLEMSVDDVSIRSITAATGHSRQKITETIKRATEKGVTKITDEMTDVWLEELLFPELTLVAKGRVLPDFDYIHKELAKPGVTLSLLHSEYESDCRLNKRIPYAYRTFCQYYTNYAKKYKATMRIRRKPGEIMEVDWAGTTAFIIDRITGEKVPVYVFVATLPCSQLSYCEGCLSMTSEAWIGACARHGTYLAGESPVAGSYRQA